MLSPINPYSQISSFFLRSEEKTIFQKYIQVIEFRMLPEADIVLVALSLSPFFFAPAFAAAAVL